jgi:hypothetical protein
MFEEPTRSKSLSLSEEIKTLLEGFKLGSLGVNKTPHASVESVTIVTNDYYMMDKKRVYQVHWKEWDGYNYLMYMAPSHRAFMAFCTLYLVAGKHLTVSKEDHFTYFKNGEQTVPVKGNVLVPHNWDWGCEAKRGLGSYSEVKATFRTIFAKIQQDGIENLVDFVGWWKPDYASTDYSEEVTKWAHEKNVLSKDDAISLY